MTHVERAKPLLLAGGQSTRMESPKYLLRYPDGRPLLFHLLDILQISCPKAQEIFVSVHQKSQASELEQFCFSYKASRLQIVLDADSNSNAHTGPAAGLLAAHEKDPEAYWVVLACDYPLVSTTALQQLCEEFVEPVTCFQNEEGWCEPFLGIWGPKALQKLQKNVAKGITSPSRAVLEVGGTMIRPKNMIWMTNTNTKEQWYSAMELALRGPLDLY